VAEKQEETDVSLPPQVPRPVNRPNAQPEADDRRDNVQREMTGFERGTLRWARVAVFMSALAAIFVCLQWWEMHTGGQDTHELAVAAKGQAEKMQSVSDAADKIRQASQDMVIQNQRIADNSQKAMDASNRQSKAALDATIANAKRDQRAWVGVIAIPSEGFTETVPWKATVVFFNSGRTPARIVQSSGMFITSPIPISGPPPEQIKRLIFKPAQSIAPQGSYREVLGMDYPAVVSTAVQKQGQQTLLSQYVMIKNKQLFLYYFGILKYDDSFGKHRETQFCIFLANPETKEAGFCDAFNDLN
jgi:hypothetical protein